MKIPDVSAEVIGRAVDGDFASLDALLASIQPAIFNLAIRFLGNREDAEDASQEILLKVVTHLAGFKGDSGFSTWVYLVATNTLLTAKTRTKESPETSLEALEERLGAGLAYANRTDPAALLPEDKLDAKRMALRCTQGMLMALEREQRIVYFWTRAE